MTAYNVAPIRFAPTSMVTTALGPNDPQVGDTCEEGGLRYVFVYNEGGASVPVGFGVVLNSAATGYSVTVTSTTSLDYLIGVNRNATLTTGAYGWVVTRGMVNVQMLATSGSVAAKGLLELGASGLFAPYSNTTGNGKVWGQAVSAIVSGASGQAFISTFV